MASQEAAVAASGSPEEKSRAVILVVDDEQGLRDLICRTLRSEGFTALEAGHGGEALVVLENSPDPVDMVVTDVVMPGMDGRELGRRLSQRWPEIPVLYISAYDVNDIFRRGSPRDSAPFLQKPFALENLVSTIRDLLSARHGR
jgi:two-component system cell cycle sensor histidine kinase/response regulator CckA